MDHNRRYQEVKRKQTWKNKPFFKKIRFDFTKYTATEFKNFNSFNGFFNSSVFYFEDRVIKGNITLEEDIFKVCPLSYPSTCSNCLAVAQRDQLSFDLDTLAWTDLKIRNVPDSVPIGIKNLALDMRSMLKNHSDNASAKSFTVTLLKTVKSYFLCTAHGENCEVKTTDVGGFDVIVEIEQALSPLDSFSSDSSKSLKERAQLRPSRRVLYIEADMCSSEMSGTKGGGESTGSDETVGEEQEISDNESSVEQPFSRGCTTDTVCLSGIPDVVLINCRQLTIISAEDQHVKENITLPTPKSDVGQLLFYMLGMFIVHSEKNEQQHMGLYIEGENVLICYGVYRRLRGNSQASVQFHVSKFYNLLNKAVIKMICKAIFSAINLSLHS